MRNIFLVRGSEKTLVQLRKTGSVAKSAASHLSTGKYRNQNYSTEQCYNQKKSIEGLQKI